MLNNTGGGSRLAPPGCGQYLGITRQIFHEWQTRLFAQNTHGLWVVDAPQEELPDYPFSHISIFLLIFLSLFLNFYAPLES